jgi:gamma-glutamyl-gamma-aminobutyrate hydrolase PuuD
MKRVLAISQRVDSAPLYRERRDGLDQRWATLAQELGLLLVPLPNLAQMTGELLAAVSPAGLILSGGNDLTTPDEEGSAPERDSSERQALLWAESAGGRPVLGVCRGMQAIQLHCGGKLTSVRGHVASRHPLLTLNVESPILLPREVNSFHNFGLTTDILAPALVPVGVAEDGMVEAFRHKHLPWYGIMWHPERECPFQIEDMKTISTIFGVVK